MICRIFTVLLIAFAISLVKTKQIYVDEPLGRIVGGHLIAISKIPYMVSLQSGYFNTHECGGAVIGHGKDSKTWVLTAAHCVEDPNRKFYIRYGSSFNDKNGKTINVSEIISHPNFLRKTMDFDVALLKLDGQIQLNRDVQKLGLPAQDESVAIGTVLRVSGWGRTNNDEDSRDQIRTVEVDAFDHSQCAKNYKELGYQVTDNMICAARDGKDACQQDSGGPLVSKESKIVGIVSWGDKCASDKYPGVYTRVSAFRDWIREKCGI